MDPRDEQLVDLCRWLAGRHDPNWIAAIILGILGPTCLATYGVVCVVTGEATFLQSRPIEIVTWTGTPAICLGLGYIAIALFAHFQCVWLPSQRFHVVGQIGKIASAALGAVALCYLAYHVLAVM